ncbi:MAG: 3-phosphoserine/phosphohydroxythreonine transaminase [Burkholderiales bacterium]
MARIFNFSAGPAVLPEDVLAQASAEMLDWHGSGMSVMEMSHRGKEFIAICEQAEADLRELLAIPKEYKVLFLQGGATLQFGMLPMNLLRGKTSADYFNTGEWSKKAIKEAKAFCKVNVAASAEDANFTYAPDQANLKLDPQAAYVHYTSNETIGGVEYHWIPQVGEVPLVVDMSSHILSKPVDIKRFGLIYAGAQKNIGPAGLTIVIVREDLLGGAGKNIPSLMDYKVHADAGSMSNTPPTYAIYIAGLVFQWIKRQGGIAEMERRALERSSMLYQYLDASRFFMNPVRKQDRSRMNVPFTLLDSKFDDEFLAGAKQRGMQELKGHRSVGGMRASMYNAMPVEGVKQLVGYLREFEASHV